MSPLRVRTQIVGQGAVVASLHSAVLDQVNLANSMDSGGTSLMQKLIALPSIITKSNKNGKQIIGRGLFHSIVVPTEDPECYLVSYFAVNAPEASGVLGALPVFIEETLVPPRDGWTRGHGPPGNFLFFLILHEKR